VLPIFVGSGFEGRLCGTTRVLPQAPRCAVYWEWQGGGTLFSRCRRTSPLAEVLACETC
jgi:hypothetical protein